MQGRASQVTDLGDGTVLRRGGDPEREARLMALAAAHGVRVPRVLELHGDAMVMERIDGPTMEAALRRRPWRLRRQVDALARLHAQVHRVPLDGASLLHLDLHPQNVLLATEGPVLIDWTNARSGDPALDVALTWLILATSGGLGGRLLAMAFRSRVGRDIIRAGLAEARTFRLADPNVTDAERARVLRIALDETNGVRG